MRLKKFHTVIKNTPESVKNEVHNYLNELDLKAKMEKYFSECNPSDLVEKFEKLGYEFEKIKK